jgi:hypothetical protein
MMHMPPSVLHDHQYCATLTDFYSLTTQIQVCSLMHSRLKTMDGMNIDHCKRFMLPMYAYSKIFFLK